MPMLEHVPQESLQLSLSRQASLFPHLDITLCEPFAGLDQLDDVNVLLKEHEDAGDAEKNPRDDAVYLVGSIFNVSR